MISLPSGQRALVYSVDEMDTLTPFKACLCFDIPGPMGGRSLAEIISRMVIFTSGAAHRFLLCKCITFAWNKSYCQEPGQPPMSTHLTGNGRLGEVTGGEVQRAVPKSARC